jgi:hypothetical protein
MSDSAFGSFEEMLQVIEWGGTWTTAMPINANASLWNLLSYNNADDTWRAAVDEYGRVASSSTMIVEESGKIVHKQVLSCAFNAVENDLYKGAIIQSGKQYLY